MKNSTLIILLTISLSSYAQHRKTVFVEGLGNGMLISANYDMRLKPNQNDGWGFRAGIGGGSVSNFGNTSFSLISMPLSVNYIIGKKRNGFESGFGITPFYVSTEFNHIDRGISYGAGLSAAAFFNLGYRFQPIKRGPMFRANLAPAIFRSAGFIPIWSGLSVGYSFK